MLHPLRDSFSEAYESIFLSMIEGGGDDVAAVMDVPQWEKWEFPNALTKLGGGKLGFLGSWHQWGAQTSPHQNQRVSRFKLPSGTQESNEEWDKIVSKNNNSNDNRKEGNGKWKMISGKSNNDKNKLIIFFSPALPYLLTTVVARQKEHCADPRGP